MLQQNFLERIVIPSCCNLCCLYFGLYVFGFYVLSIGIAVIVVINDHFTLSEPDSLFFILTGVALIALGISLLIWALFLHSMKFLKILFYACMCEGLVCLMYNLVRLVMTHAEFAAPSQLLLDLPPEVDNPPASPGFEWFVALLAHNVVQLYGSLVVLSYSRHLRIAEAGKPTFSLEWKRPRRKASSESDTEAEVTADGEPSSELDV